MRTRRAFLPIILLLSGASALVFENLWLRLSGLTFGNSVWAAALILSSFMGGLALGNALAARWSSLPGRPLRIYVALELSVAVLGSAIVFLLPHLGEALRPLFRMLWVHQAMLMALRFVLSFGLLLVPTTAMGLTLPVLLEDRLLRDRAFGRTVSLLYGANTIGGVAGVLLAEFWLVGRFGLLGTSVAALSLSVTAAALAWFAARDGVEGHSVPEAPLEKTADAAGLGVGESRPVNTEAASLAEWRFLVCAFGCGAILLGLEVVWFRFLRLYVSSSTAAFAIMLAAILAGLGSGGLASGPIQRKVRHPARFLAGTLMLAAIATLATYAWFPVPAAGSTSNAFNVESWTRIAGLAAFLMLPGSFLSGVLFPAVIAGLQACGHGRMNSAGAVTLANTIGATAGPLLAAFGLLPWLGFQQSLVVCAAGYAILALLVSKRQSWSPQSRGGRLLLVLAAAGLAMAAFFPYSRDRRHLANARQPYTVDGSKLVTCIEGTADTLQLLRRDLYGEPYYYRLVTDNFSMSSTHPRSQRYMRLFAYLPLAFRPEAEDALQICYGVGVTADALTHDRRLRRIDIVDISREVFSLADQYKAPDTADPLRDPRVTTYVQDGRFYLQACPRQYDLITGEPPPLKVAGTVNLYTEEFFAAMRVRLKAGGMASFWLPVYQLEVGEAKSILRAFHDVFPDSSVWGGPDGEWIMLGVNGASHAVSMADLEQWWRDPTTRADLVRVGFEVPGQLGACFVMDGDEIERITKGVAPLTDLFPKRLGDRLPASAPVRRFVADYMQADAAYRRFLASRWIASTWPAGERELEPFFVLRETSFRLATEGGNWLAALDFFLRGTRLRGPVEEALNTDEVRIALAQRAATAPSRPPGLLSDLIAGAIARRDLPAAIGLLEREGPQTLRSGNDLYLLQYLYCLTGQVAKAEALATATPSTHDWFVDWLWNMLHDDFGFQPPAPINKVTPVR